MKSAHSVRTTNNKFGSTSSNGGFRGRSNGSSHFGSRGGGYKPDNSRFFSKSRRSNPYRDQPLKEDLYVSKAVASEQVSIYDNTVTFSDFKLNQKLLANINKKGYVHPTQIQSQVIQSILDKKDVLGLASTGSGKTAAFLIPMVNATLENPRKRCLIVAPTRELATQIQQEFKALTEGTYLKEVLIVGGASAWDQIRLLNREPQFIFATPGRLIDLYTRKKIDLATFDNVVLDEVDQMLDMGFLTDVKRIISNLKQPRQSLFFSATMKPKLEEIAMSLLVEPVKVQVSITEAARNVDQDIVRVGKEKKVDVLHKLLINADFTKVLIFARTKHGADDISRELQIRGHVCESLHSNKPLGQRNRILTAFRKDTINILIATDIASRGIDVKDISHVINYDEPANKEDYIHRIGRTGRVGKKGTALTLLA